MARSMRIRFSAFIAEKNRHGSPLPVPRAMCDESKRRCAESKLIQRLSIQACVQA